jgi:hypothetical protein
MKQLLSRKFLIAVLASSLCFAALLAGKIGGDSFTNIILSVLAVYGISNVAQKSQGAGQ